MLTFTKKEAAGFDPTKLVKSLGKNRILAPALEHAFKGFDEAWSFRYEPKKSDNAWHPSGDCLPSVTELYERASIWPERAPIGSSLQKNFMVGHYWHQLIQHMVVKLELAESESIERVGQHVWATYPQAAHLSAEPVTTHTTTGILHVNGLESHWEGLPKPFHWMRGSGDIVPLKTKDWTGIVDIKTMSGNMFRQATLPSNFAAKYVCQINIYMELFDQAQGMIFAVNKDTPHDFKELTFVRNQRLIDAILDKWQFVSECLDKDAQPTTEDDEEFSLPEIPEVNNVC